MDLLHLDDPIIDAADGTELDPTQFVVFDNDGLTPDRYTIFPYLSLQGLSDASRGVGLALSADPDHAGGTSQWIGLSARAVRNHAVDLGRRVSWQSLPQGVRSHVRFRLAEEGGSFDLVAPELASLRAAGGGW